MATVAELLVKITADISDIKSGLTQGAQTLETFGSRAQSSFDEAGKHALGFGDVLKANIISGAVIGGFRALGGAISGALGDLKDFAKGGLENASNLAEVQNVVDTTFGAGAAQIDAFAKSAAGSFGLSELSAKQFSGTIGAMLKSTGLTGDSVQEMSTKITGLAGDFASFYNLDPEDAFAKIRSGISGETEPLKQLGINLSVANLQAYALKEGITKQYSAMTQAEQTTLRYNYLLSATADAQGDFAKTADSYANQQRILQLNMQNLATTLGSKLLPSVNTVTTAFNALLTGQMDAATFGKTVGGVISDLANMLIKELPELVNVGVEIFEALVEGLTANAATITGAAVEVITTLTGSIISELPAILQLGLTILTSLVQGIAASLPTMIPLLVQTLLSIIKVWYDNLPLLIQAGLDLLKGLVTGIINAIPILIDMLPQVIDSMISALTDMIPLIIDTGITLLVALIGALPQIITAIVGQLPKIITGITNALIGAIPLLVSAGVQLFIALVKNLPAIIVAIVKAIPEIITAIVNAFGNYISTIADVGFDLIKGLWQGIKDAGRWLYDKIVGLGSDVINWVKGIFGSHSPSTVFAGIGSTLAQGLGVGFANSMNNTRRTIASAASGLASLATSALGTPTMTLATAGSYGVTRATPDYAAQEPGITINISGLSVREEADVQKVSAQLYRLQQDRLRQRGFNG